MKFVKFEGYISSLLYCHYFKSDCVVGTSCHFQVTTKVQYPCAELSLKNTSMWKAIWKHS